MRSCCIPMIVALLFAGQALPAAADVASDLGFIMSHKPIDAPARPALSRFPSEETNELKLLASGLIRSYQVFISSQGTDACVFTPSCSNFSMAAINRYGFAHGLLMTFDRFQRCYSGAAQYYSFDAGIGKSIDPIEDEYVHAH